MKRLSTLLLLAMTMLTVTAKSTDNVIKVNAGDAESLLDAIQQANTRNADSLRSEWQICKAVLQCQRRKSIDLPRGRE